jgi:hypothetical protein
MSQRATFAVALLSALLVPEVARAGRVEEFVQVAMHPNDPNVMTVRYAYGGDGTIVTTDGGKTWKLLCNAAVFGYVMANGGPIIISGDGTTTLGVFSGMWHDDGHACGWRTEPQYDGWWVVAFAQDPVDPNVTYAATSSGGKLNGLLRRAANGAWSDLGTREDVLITDLQVVARGTARRFYVAAVKGTVTPPDGGFPEANYVIRVTDDDGATWTEHVYGWAGGNLHLQGVDPTNPDRIVISIQRAVDGVAPLDAISDRVLVSNDQGASFKDYLTLTEIGGVTFAPDGRVWIGDAGTSFDQTQPKGVWFAQSLGVPATKLPMSDYPAQCLSYQSAADTLFACQRWTFGKVDTTDGSFTTSLNVRKVEGFVECSGVNMTAACETQLCNAWCGAAHFAEAPMCCAYNSPTCGPAIAPTALCPVQGDAGGTGGDGGIDGSVKDAGSGVGGGSGAGGASVAGGTDGAAGSSGTGGAGGFGGFGAFGGATAKPAGEDGGCCSVAGRTRSSSGSAGAVALAVAAATALRRRRRLIRARAS